jgi:hypothetical protein
MLLYTIQIPVDGFHHICEVQVKHFELKALSETIDSHHHYEYFGVMYAGSDQTVADRLNDLASIVESDNMDETFIRVLLSSKDVERLRIPNAGGALLGQSC